MITRARFTFSGRLRDRTFLIAVFSLLAFGRSLTAQAVDRYSFPLDREAPRGIQIIRYSVPNGRPDEISVLPRHLGFAKYRGKEGAEDTADESKLARYDFYKSGNTPDDGAVALFPKNKSTSAAVELFEIPQGSSKPAEETASYCTSIRKTSKDMAKFKQTDNVFTTTSTAAILGYYHVSRALGDICEIQPAILRTMDIEQHKKVVKLTGGNISDYNVVYYLQDNQVKHSRKADNVPPGATQVSVKKLTIVDTDAGLLNQNVFEQKGYLNQICHLHPDTYNRLLDFAQRWKTDPEVKGFFHQECTFSNGQLARFEKYLLNAAATMQSRRAAGKLLLDLDLDDFFKPEHS